MSFLCMCKQPLFSLFLNIVECLYCVTIVITMTEQVHSANLHKISPKTSIISRNKMDNSMSDKIVIKMVKLLKIIQILEGLQ